MHRLKIISRLKDYSVCRWYDCSGCEPLLRFSDHEEAARWLRDLATDESAMRDLRTIAATCVDTLPMARTDDVAVRDQLSRLLATGRLRVCGAEREQRRQTRAVLREARPAPPPRPARRMAEPPPTVAQEVEAATFPASLDAALMAQTLKDAAAGGVPFCEECEKARRAAPPPPAAEPVAEPDTFPANVDGVLAAQMLREAAVDGAPFCEECEKARAAQAAAEGAH